MHINNHPIRWAGQRFGANYADPHPGEHVDYFLSIEHARQVLQDDPLGCTGDTIALWAVSPHDSEGEVISRTRTDLAEAHRIVTLGPRGGTTVERI